MIEKGGRRDIFLGTRECQGYVEPCQFLTGDSFYDNYGDLSFGFMLHGINYPDETNKNELGIRFWNCEMRDGIIKFPKPNDSSLKTRTVRKNVSVKKFGLDNTLSVEKEEGGED